MACHVDEPRSWIAIEDHALVFLRHSSDPEARAGLMHAARVLSRLDHPGVESFVTIRVDDSSTTLVTRFIGGRTLAAASVDDPTRRARIAAAVFANLADLHDAGVAHGPFTYANLRVGAGGAVTSCGFGDATMASDVDPATWRLCCIEDLWTVAEVLARSRRRAPIPGRRSPSSRILERRFARVLQRIATGTITDAATASAACRRLLPGERNENAGARSVAVRAARPHRRLAAAVATALIVLPMPTILDHRFTRTIGAPAAAPGSTITAGSTPAVGAPDGTHPPGRALSADD